MNLEPIDTSTTAGKARVMQLAAEGREVASRPKGATSGWYIAPAAAWDWPNYNYAIIAEPVGPDEVWVGIAPGGSLGSVTSSDAGAAIFRDHQIVRYIRADLAGEAS